MTDLHEKRDVLVADMALEKSTTAESTGVPQEAKLEKNFSIWSLGSLCLCLMATWEALSTVVAQALISGGAPCLFYNYILSFLGSMLVVVSLAEMASMYPTAGGWISIGGQIMLTASAALAGGLQMQGLIVLNNLDTYIPRRWQGMLFYDLVLLYALMINIYGVKVLAHTNTVSGVLHILGFIAITVTLLAIAPKRSAEFVFVETSNTSGWTDGAAWLVGLLSTTYGFLGYDAAVHMAEELPRPKINVARAMVGSVLVNGCIGLVYCIVLLYSLPDLEGVLASPTGFPFMQIFFDDTKNTAAATVLSLVPCLIAIAANAAGLTSTSRTFWSLARDNATPKSKYFTHIDNKLHVPVRMIVLTSIIEVLLGFLYLQSSTAFNACLSMAILGMYLSYALPIVYMLFFGRKGAHTLGPFNLGRYGVYLNVLALVWLVVNIVFGAFPSSYPVTAITMNYSTVVLAGWIAFGATYYMISGRHTYCGATIELDGVARTITRE